MFHNSNVFGSPIIHILYIYSTNIGTEYFKYGIYTPFFSSSRCSLFHNSNVFVSCNIHILYIYSINIVTEYFKHGIYSPFFPLQNAFCFIILTYLVPVLFTFYKHGVLKLKKNNSGAKRLISKQDSCEWCVANLNPSPRLLNTSPPGKNPGSHRLRCCVQSQLSLDIFYSCHESNYSSLVTRLVA